MSKYFFSASNYNLLADKTKTLFSCEDGKSLQGGTSRPLVDCTSSKCSMICQFNENCNGFTFNRLKCHCDIFHDNLLEPSSGNDCFCRKWNDRYTIKSIWKVANWMKVAIVHNAHDKTSLPYPDTL